MFGIFGKNPKEDSLDEDVILSAGVTAGVAFRQIEKKHGLISASEAPDVIEACKRAACEMLSFVPDERSRQALHMVTLVFAMDDSGIAEKITSRYQRGDKSIYPNEARQIWALTLSKTQEIAGALAGKR